MVLKQKVLGCLILAFSIKSYVFSQSDIAVREEKTAYVFDVISQILNDSPHGIALANEENSMNLSFEQQEKYWLPSIQFDISADSNLVQGDFNYVKNRGIISDPQIILSPSLNVGITQNLPGNGRVSINAGYGLSCLPSQNGYKQQPYLQIGMSQPISHGMFSTSKDPSIARLKNQKNMAKLEYQNALFELVCNFIGSMQSYNIALLEKEYYSVVLKKIESEYDEHDNRFGLGQESTVDLFNLHMKNPRQCKNFSRLL